MASFALTRPMRLVLLVCAAVAFAVDFPRAAAADEGTITKVTGQVEEVVGTVGQVAAPLQEVGGTVAATPAAVAPAVTEVLPAVPPPPVPPPPVSTPNSTSTQVTTAIAGVASSAGAATKVAGGAAKAVKEDAETAGTLSTAPGPSATPDASSSDAAAPEVVDPADSSSALAGRSLHSRRGTYVPPPANDGATGAPLPRWIAYVWPAVALTGPYLTGLAGDWSKASLQLASEASAGLGAGQGVAGIHASGGRHKTSDSDSSLLSKIPAAVGRQFSNVPTPALVYLGVLVLAVVAVGIAVRREIAIGRRQGRP